MTSMETGKRPSALIARYTTDAGEYLDHVGVFLRRRPVEHSVLLSTVATRLRKEASEAGSNLWLWVEDDVEAGSRFFCPNFVHSMESSGANSTTKTGLND